jgi:hypothetical protein
MPDAVRRVSLAEQHAPYRDEEPVSLGPMTSATWRWNPRRLGMMLARYKFVSKMLAGKTLVAEIGVGDGFGSDVVRTEVGRLVMFDSDATWSPHASSLGEFYQADIAISPLLCVGNPPRGYDAVYMLDVFEHIHPDDEDKVLTNICKSLTKDGVLIVGCPSLESQAYASAVARMGHVNCKSGADLKTTMDKYFTNVFSFGMNDEVLHTGFHQMCHYLFAVCAGVKA